jgi:hypothetical protein
MVDDMSLNRLYLLPIISKKKRKLVMKKEYKDLMVSYLNTKENVKIRSFPGGWSGNKFEMDGRGLGSNDRVPYLINKEMLEYALINRFLFDNTRSFTSYELTYNKEKQQFEGKIKNRVNEAHDITVNVEIPENIWFNNIDVNIGIKSKKEVSVSLNLNVRNGMFPENIEESLQSSILNQIKNIKGRVDGRILRNLSYSKQYTLSTKVNSLHHESKKIEIPIF